MPQLGDQAVLDLKAAVVCFRYLVSSVKGLVCDWH